jgi:hypothetical protein
MLQQTGRKGLMLVLDEVETLQRMRSDVREKSLNALRQWIDDIDGGRYPGLYLLVTGTPAFFDGNQGVKRLPPSRSGSTSTSPTTRAGTTCARCRSGCCPSTPRGWPRSAARCATSTPRRIPMRLWRAWADAFIAALAADVTRRPRRQGRRRAADLPEEARRGVLDRVDASTTSIPRALRPDAVAAELTPEECEAAGVVRSVDDIALALAPRDGPPRAT